MRPCSEAPHLCWMSWLLGSTSLLLSVCSTAVESSRKSGTAQSGSGAHVSVKGVQGGSIIFNVRSNSGIAPGAELTEITWSFGSGPDSRVILRVSPTVRNATWLGLKDKYEQRLQVLNSTALRIDNLTSEDTGQYKAVAIFTKESQLNQFFHLTVYEPVPLPHILVSSSSAITRDWCNITLECTVQGNTEDLNVTWESQDLPTEWGQRVTPGPAPNPWTLAMNLPLIQPNSKLICVVSNQVDQKNATRNLEDICHSPDKQLHIRRHILIIVMVVTMLILGFGFYLWKACCKKKMETQRGAQMQAQHRGYEDGVQYADIIHPETQESQYESIGQRQESYNTVYSKVGIPDQTVKLS